MKKPTFIHGVFVAAVLAFAASAIIATLTPFVGFNNVVKLLIPGLAFAYLLFLFRSSDERIGRLTTLVLWGVLATLTWWFSPPLGLYLLVHVGAIWLVRSLYFYSGVFPSLIDLGLSALSISAFGWAIERTGSIFLGIWCFFLVQALFVAIPKRIAKRSKRIEPKVDSNGFEQARRQADKALQQIFSS